MDKYEVSEVFLGWLEKRILHEGRGDNDTEIDVDPSGKYWFGRIAPEEYVASLGMGDRGERLEPCAIGLRVLPKGPSPWAFDVTISASVWIKEDDKWKKSKPCNQTLRINYSKNIISKEFFEKEINDAFVKCFNIDGYSAKILVEHRKCLDNDELTIQFVNTTSESKTIKDQRLYETSLIVHGLELSPFILESLPDSFRFNRNVWAYGINAGVRITEKGHVETIDLFGYSKYRPRFWPTHYPELSLTFSSLEERPIEISNALLNFLKRWGQENWSTNVLDDIASRENWTRDMREEATQESKKFFDEVSRIEAGVQCLLNSIELLSAFKLMNKAIGISSKGKYDCWRPFQLGFLLANLDCIVAPEKSAETVDIVWFATGGGKTETYLGLLVTAAIFDRFRGKISGITAWSRFPLRMLSLQQTQRFANAMAAAETVRREYKISGENFSMGFFVGQTSTPNAINPDSRPGDQWDPDDPKMPERLRVLEYCPFCRMDTVAMAFNRKEWKVEHQCSNDTCPWPEVSLPFYVVDDEIYRFLPTILVGTLDKAASISMQASMRGLVGAPWGRCSREGHGHTYAPRSNKPTGCLVPGCKAPVGLLSQDAKLYGPSFRLQDELHLLKDSLGAVDAFYEAVFDGLQQDLGGTQSKILASSATLTGYEKQSDVLYRRKARVFPLAGPSIDKGFWSSTSDSLMRRYLAIAPRGVTIEYTVDRLMTELQRSIRKLEADPISTCQEVGIPLEYVEFIVSNYGTNVVYGNTLRDLDAVVRSMGTQIDVPGTLNTALLTGRSEFEEVRNILQRLEAPEDSFQERLHLVSASSMMSHGIDVDRLNVMVMLGLPLGTAEFIQATARVGRRWPGLVFVVHKIGRERDASVFRSFDKFIEQGDRFVEAVPISRRSRRVLERTLSGLVQARILAIHEPKSDSTLTTVSRLRDFVRTGQLTIENEFDALVSYLELNTALDAQLREDIRRWLTNFFRNIEDPPADARFISDLSPSGSPMRSLRDVEEQVPIYGSVVR